jgi:hypothetical protein
LNNNTVDSRIKGDPVQSLPHDAGDQLGTDEKVGTGCRDVQAVDCQYVVTRLQGADMVGDRELIETGAGFMTAIVCGFGVPQ